MELRANPIDAEGKPRKIEPEHEIPELPSDLQLYAQLDEELVGALDQGGCFHDPVAVNALLIEYGVADAESRKTARTLLRYIGLGRAEALNEEE